MMKKALRKAHIGLRWSLWGGTTKAVLYKDIGSLNEEKWVCSQCSGVFVGRVWRRKKFVILVKGKECWLGSVRI